MVCFSILFLRTSAWNWTDSPLSDLADVWNEVMVFRPIAFLLVRGLFDLTSDARWDST